MPLNMRTVNVGRGGPACGGSPGFVAFAADYLRHGERIWLAIRMAATALYLGARTSDQVAVSNGESPTSFTMECTCACWPLAVIATRYRVCGRMCSIICSRTGYILRIHLTDCAASAVNRTGPANDDPWRRRTCRSEHTYIRNWGIRSVYGVTGTQATTISRPKRSKLQ